MIDEIRMRQQQQQIQSIGRRRSSGTVVATYQGRDTVTGDRLLQSADGSIVRAKWISTSNPDNIPTLVVPSGTIGQSGYASQR